MKIKKITKNTFLKKIYLCVEKFLSIIPDSIYLKFLYRIRMGKKLNLKNPVTFNEKLNWLKINNRKSVFTDMVDKFAVKSIVASELGKEYIVPTLGVWDRFEDIDFDELPKRFVLKCTHDSGSVFVCRNKDKLDKNKLKKKFNAALKRNFYWKGREWPYKNVRPRIFAEEYIEDKNNPNLSVYKFFCFNGKPKIIQTIQNDKQPNETIDYFDCQWNLLDLRQNFPNSTKPLSKPEKLDEMLEIVSRLSGNIPFLRVDLYDVNGKIMFSEFTFFTDAGAEPFDPEYWDIKLGKLLKIK